MTGSAGPKVGQFVAAELAMRHTLTGMDMQASPLTTHVADITSVEDWPSYLDGIDAVVHFAALHAPHRETHSRAQFIATNVDATARLVAAARAAGVKRFILASTTSVYGKAMRTRDAAAWVTEDLMPEPEDIYDETKLAAEAICRDAFGHGFVTAALRFSRSFPEPPHLMALYRLYRGVDGRDVAQAFGDVLVAPLDRFHALNISGETPFQQGDCDALFHDPVAVLEQRVPDLIRAFAARNWPLPTCIDRVYVTEKARQLIGFEPRHGWRSVVETERGAS